MAATPQELRPSNVLASGCVLLVAAHGARNCDATADEQQGAAADPEGEQRFAVSTRGGEVVVIGVLARVAGNRGDGRGYPTGF